MYVVSNPEIQTSKGHRSLNIYYGFGLNFPKVRKTIPKEITEMFKKKQKLKASKDILTMKMNSGVHSNLVAEQKNQDPNRDAVGVN